MALLSLCIEQAGPGDAGDFATIQTSGGGIGWSADSVSRTLASRDTLAFKAKVPGSARTLGFLVLRRVADEAEVILLAVAPDSRRRGIGDALLREAMAALRAPAKVFLDVAADNIPAIQLYEKHSFSAMSRRPGYYRRDDGEPADAVCYMRTLTAR